MRLYDLNAAQQALLDEIADAEGELTPELEARLLALEAEAVPALENMARYIKTLEAQADVFRQEQQRCTARRGTLEKKAERLKAMVVAFMQERGIDRAKGHTLMLRLDPGRPACNVKVSNDIPERFRVVVPASWTPDKAAIIKATNAGETVPGVEIVRNPYIVIR